MAEKYWPWKQMKNSSNLYPRMVKQPLIMLPKHIKKYYFCSMQQQDKDTRMPSNALLF